MDGLEARGKPTEWSGDCEAWLEDGRVLRGTLSPTTMDGATVQLWAGGAAGMIELPLRSLQLLCLLHPRPGLFAPQEQVRGRPFRLDLGAQGVRRAWCVGLRALPELGQWLDVRLASGEAQAWFLPVRAATSKIGLLGLSVTHDWRAADCFTSSRRPSPRSKSQGA